MASPCIRLCAIDAQTRLCTGCGRTLEEIGRWVGYDDSQRRRIMAALPERLARIRQNTREEGRS